ncbi:MAG: MarR family winged helix-turn-helix transcriptional regulator [Chloroflexota bacterium]|nr:MarR family winged helix-turn-helix transcriptional regulator [Chloroflexota bacterium]
MFVNEPSAADLDLARQVRGLLPRLGRLWSQTLREAGGPSIVRVRLLATLSDKGPSRAGELAFFCGTTPSAVTELIDGLVSEGQVSRDDDPRDRRAVVLTLTDRGRAELHRVEDLMTNTLLRALEGLSVAQRSRLRTALADLNEILSGPAAQKETHLVR